MTVEQILHRLEEVGLEVSSVRSLDNVTAMKLKNDLQVLFDDTDGSFILMSGRETLRWSMLACGLTVAADAGSDECYYSLPLSIFDLGDGFGVLCIEAVVSIDGKHFDILLDMIKTMSL